MLEAILDRPVAIEHQRAVRGDPRRTEADVGRAVRDLGYRPETSLEEGLAAQVKEVAARTVLEAA
jgi:nucleoside-diphosphate-sugar epimerase